MSMLYILLPLLSIPTPLLSLHPSVGCGLRLPTQAHSGHSHQVQLAIVDPNIGMVARGYRLHVPSNYPTSNLFPVSLVVDYHGWGGNSTSQEKDSQFIQVADEDPEGFLVASAQGMSDQSGNIRGSFNCSQTDGPLGPPCDTDRSRWGEIPCYDSCPKCDPLNSCDWTSCHDDVLYTQALVQQVSELYCVDLDSVHLSGISNGGMFSYYIASRVDIFATIAPAAASPLLGFGDVPTGSISVIDFHGENDDTIPYSLDSSYNEGKGPYGTVISWDGYYYYDKPTFIRDYTEGLDCDTEYIWPTQMDGEDEFIFMQHRNCRDGNEVVHCKGNHGHDYPFSPDRKIEGTRILWSFMKTHPKKKNYIYLDEKNIEMK